jgi:predicted phosphodiesterase
MAIQEGEIAPWEVGLPVANEVISPEIATKLEPAEALLRRSARICGRAVLRTGRIAGLVGLRAGLPILCSVGAMGAYGETSAEIGPAKVSAHLTADLYGDVTLRPGLGEITYNVSDGPLGMDIRINSLDKNAPAVVQRQLDTYAEKTEEANFNATDLLTGYKSELDNLADRAKLKGGLLLLGGGVFGAAVAEMALGLTRTHRQREFLDKQDILRMCTKALLIPTLAVQASGGLVAMTTHEHALEHPQFGNDSLSELVDFVKDSIDSREKYLLGSAQASEWFSDLNAIQKNLEGVPSAEGLIPVLLMGDSHKRPCAYEIARLLQSEFHTVLTIHAGDEEDGNPLLMSQLASTESCPDDTMASLSGPVLFVPGNHDSPQIAANYDSYKNVIVPHDETVEVPIETVYGKTKIRITGGADPVYTPDFSERDSKALEEQQEIAFGRRIGKIALKDRPDLIVVHSAIAANAASEVMGEVRKDQSIWILNGHTHSFNLNRGKMQLTVGSIGGGGLRSYEKEPHEERSTRQATVMYLDPLTRRPVWGWNFIVQNDGRAESYPIYFQDPEIVQKTYALKR